MSLSVAATSNTPLVCIPMWKQKFVRLSCWPQGITTGEMAGFHGEWKPRQSKLYRFGFLVDRSFGDFGKRLVRGFLLVERFLKKVGCVLQPQFFRPGAEGAVA